VEVHETYYANLNARVEELRPLLQKIAKREAVVQERIELEHIQMNPERLTARGPNAREERCVRAYLYYAICNMYVC
jgi:HEPN domain-containing protein